MDGTEWFLLIVVVILVPLAIAGAVTLWTLEQARKRNRRNRPDGKQAGVARKATRSDAAVTDEGEPREAMSEPGEGRRRDDPTYTEQDRRSEQAQEESGRDRLK